MSNIKTFFFSLSRQFLLPLTIKELLNWSVSVPFWGVFHSNFYRAWWSFRIDSEQVFFSDGFNLFFRTAVFTSTDVWSPLQEMLSDPGAGLWSATDVLLTPAWVRRKDRLVLLREGCSWGSQNLCDSFATHSVGPRLTCEARLTLITNLCL